MYGIRSTTRIALRRLLLLIRRPPSYSVVPFSVTQPVSVHPRRHFEEKVSVIIPTRNAGSDFAVLICKLKAQDGVSNPEIIVIDSGSSDETLELAHAAGAKVIRLDAEKFSHAAVRNKGAETASGQYLLFFVQDALPLGTTWLYEMMNFLQTSGTAAVSCAEYPRADSDLFYQYLIVRRYSQPGFNWDNVTQCEGAKLSYLDLRPRAVLSNIACLVRRDVFKDYGFSCAYGEDLDLSVRLLRGGHKLGFLHSVKVLHSHNRSPYYFLKRGYVDEMAAADIFPDFVYPDIADKTKLYAEILALHSRSATLGRLLDQQMYPLPQRKIVDLFSRHMDHGDGVDIHELDGETSCLAKLLSQSGDTSRAQLGMVWPKAAKHIADFASWLSGIYAENDRALAGEIVNSMQKIVALHSGMHLAYLFLTARGKSANESLWRIDNLLKSGV